MGNKVLDCTALTLTIIGAINWGLIGFFRFDLVAFLFGDMSWLSRVVYAPMIVRVKAVQSRTLFPIIKSNLLRTMNKILI